MVNTRAMAREEHSSAWHQKSESWPHISSPGRMVGHGVSEVWGRLSVGKIPPLSWSFPRQLSLPCGTSSLGKPFTSSPTHPPYLVQTAALLPFLPLPWRTGGASPLCSGEKRAPPPPAAKSDTSAKGIKTYPQQEQGNQDQCGRRLEI